MSSRKAKKIIKDLIGELHETYDVDVKINDKIPNGCGKIYDRIDGDLSIDIGYNPRINVKFLYNEVNDYDFINTVRALFHEERHLLQLCKDYQDKNPTEETISMAIRKLATMYNPEYYMDTYRMDMTEIDAEATAILKRYDYLRKEFPNVDANTLVCNLVNDKTKMDYFIKGHYKSVDEIIDAFSDKFEEVKNKKIHLCINQIKSSSYDVNEIKNESIRYLQACVIENKATQTLIDEFNSKSTLEECDLLFSSITCHLHPEIKYEQIYPCLSYVELSTENICGCSLPKVLKEMQVKHIPQEDIMYHLKAIHNVKDAINQNEAKDYLDIQSHDASLDENLNINTIHSDKDNTYQT